MKELVQSTQSKPPAPGLLLRGIVRSMIESDYAVDGISKMAGAAFGRCTRTKYYEPQR